jgi:glycosyltransferase involved in cell wall biosynthesis
MKFWIVTPSYNQLDWLKLCIASVADQAIEGDKYGTGRIEVHHHVQDACSMDGTVDWLRQYAEKVRRQQPEVSSDLRSLISDPVPLYTFSFSFEKDDGMYDAINKGWRVAPEDADVIAYLNCDEQYLPKALKQVARVFVKKSPGVVLGDVIVVGPSGEYYCHRPALIPLRPHVYVECMCLTCATFIDHRVFKSRNLLFDTSFKIIGDKKWYSDMTEKEIRFSYLKEYCSIFTDDGNNLALDDRVWEERKRLHHTSLGAFRGILKWIAIHDRLRLLTRWLFGRKPKKYLIFREPETKRQAIQLETPGLIWKTRESSVVRHLVKNEDVV